MGCFVMMQSWTDTRQQAYAWQVSRQENVGSCNNYNNNVIEARGMDMSHKYQGGCAHHQSFSDQEPIDNHTCHCSVCKRVTGQATTHVVFFNHGDLQVEGAGSLKRVPFNEQNPDGPLELCLCEVCGTPLMLDDRQKRIRVVVPNLMGYDGARLPATYHAFFDPAAGVAKPDDGRLVYEGLRPDFVWPQGA